MALRNNRILHKDGRPKFISARAVKHGVLEIRVQYNTVTGKKQYAEATRDKVSAKDVYSKFVKLLLKINHISKDQAVTMLLDAVFDSWVRYYFPHYRVLTN